MSISGDRIRDEQLTQARAAGKRMALLHLRKGLKAEVVEPGPPPGTPKVERSGDYPSDRFGVHKDVQRALSEIRTDLDYFSNSEAFSLMLDGYLMSDYELAHGELRTLRGRGAPDKNPTAWDFGQGGLLTLMRREPRGFYRRQLNAGRRRFLRTIALLWPAPVWSFFVALLIVLVAAIFALGWGDEIGDASRDVGRDHWSANAVIAAIIGVLLLLIAYLSTATQRWPIRYGLAVFWGVLLIVPAVLLSALRWVALPSRFLIRIFGKVPAS